MEYRVLGQVAAYCDGRQLALGSFRQRSLLAFLLMHANEVVSTDRLIDELWGDSAGLERQNALWVHVSNLRSALEPERAPRSEGTLLFTRSPGYLLQVRPEDVDAARFEQLLQEGRLLIDSDPAAASVVLGEALALWRGRPYEDFAYESFAQAEIARLEELRLEAVELRVDADLRRGSAAELVGELEGLARQHPLRERLTALLMLALYRSERRGDALKAFRRLRMRLADELGIEPSAALSALEAQMLAQDPALVVGGTAVGAEARLAIRGYELRERIGDSRSGVAYRAYQPMVGREVAIKVTRSEWANDPDFIQRFEAEAELVARLEHPHIVPIYDYWREPDAAYLVQRLFRPGSLADAVRVGALDPRVVAQVACDVGSALALAHRHGVVHGDIKPESILLDAERRAYLTDFSIATGVPATATSDVFGLAKVLGAAMTGPEGGAPSGPLATVLARAASADPEVRYADAASFVHAVEGAFAATPATVPVVVPDNPYKGLRPFEEADAPNFFGRERLVERLLARVGEPGPRGRFVAIVGPSGSGKSSLVSAGLLPAVRAGAPSGTTDWFVVTMTPGGQPFEELEAALLRIAVNPPASLLEQLTAGDGGIRRAVRRVLPDGGSLLLLVIDQFEELFTQAPPAVADAFLDALVGAVKDPHGALRVVITLRADFYDRPLRHRAFGELLRHGTEVITPMGPAELERSIDGPADRAGVRFEPGLLTEIVADVADRAGALPLLQYALTELFDERRGQVIELDAYRQLGEVSGAVARRADALYEELDPAQQRLTRQVFLRLVSLGDGPEVARRRTLRVELTALGGPHVDHVLDLFGRHRLLTFDRDPVTRGPTVEIAHEALLSAWARLQAWVEDGRDDVRQQRRLAVAAKEWNAAGRDDGYLLRATQLDQAAAWAASAEFSLHPGERAFLDASIARRAEERSKDEERRQREQRLRRQTRQRARLLIGSAVVLALVGVLALFAVDRSNDAERLAGQLAAATDARRLAAAAAGVAPENAQLGMLLALQALDESAQAGVAAVPEAEDALHWAIQAAGVTYPVADAAVDVRISPNGPAGVFVLPLADLVELARGAVTRTLTPAECASYAIEPCPVDGDGLAAPADAGPRDLPAGPTRTVAASTQQPLAGTTVTMWGVENLAESLGDELAVFQELTGVNVQHRVVDTHFASAAEFVGRALPDVVELTTPSPILELAARDVLVDVGTFIDEATARQAHSDYVIESVSDGSGFYAIPERYDVKGLVWYPVPEFERAGYAVPQTWDELLALSEQMVADGRAPWCLGIESGIASGWPATDWVEALVLRLGGVELYDQWVAHEIPFDHPIVRQATSMFGDIAFGPGFVNGGVAAVNDVDFLEAALPMYDDPPGCWLYYMADFAADAMPPGVAAGIDAGFFVLPPIADGQPAATFGGGVYVSATRDRPEVREFLRFVSSPEWGSVWARRPDTTFAPANAGFDPDHCRTELGFIPVDPRIGDLRVQMCTAVRDSIAAGVWRHDGSDLMPPEIGAGAFWTGMVDYIDRGPSSLDEVLAGIEAAWPGG